MEVAELLLERSRDADKEGGGARARRPTRGPAAVCLDRIIPPRRQRAQRLDLPRVRNIADLGDTMAAITTAAMEGTITTGEAAELARVVEIFVRAVETSDFERRLQQLEERCGKNL